VEPTAKVFSVGFVVGVTMALSVASLAQTAASPPNSVNPPPSSDPAQHFRSGANRLGEGASEIGEGIKQGAITTWDAIRAGMNSFAAKFNGGGSAPESSRQGGNPHETSQY
jgi:hypothetical protein